MRLQTRVRRSRTERGEVKSWVALAVGVLALVLVVWALARTFVDATDDFGTDISQPTAELAKEVLVPAGERRVTVALAVNLTKQSAVQVNPPKEPKGISARLAQVDRTNDSFTVALSEKAPRGGVRVPWKVAGLPAGASTTEETGWLGEWTVVLAITLAAVLAALGAYWLAIRRRTGQPDGSPDHSLALTAFLKVAALLAISALAVLVVLLATDEDAANLTALFTLFGTIAGYLAGTRTSTEDEPGADRTVRPAAGDGGDDDDPDPGLAGRTQAPHLQQGRRYGKSM